MTHIQKSLYDIVCTVTSSNKRRNINGQYKPVTIRLADFILSEFVFVVHIIKMRLLKCKEMWFEKSS